MGAMFFLEGGGGVIYSGYFNGCRSKTIATIEGLAAPFNVMCGKSRRRRTVASKTRILRKCDGMAKRDHSFIVVVATRLSIVSNIMAPKFRFLMAADWLA